MALIKFFESTDAGAPTLNNAVGSMIAVLDACLITGYNTKSITSITVASGVATVACTAHAYANTYGKDIRIAGATGSFTALNKDTNIANVTTNGFTFLCPGVADGAATGTLTAKYAPLNWTKQYTGTNKAMYKRGDVTATGCMLRIDDNAVGQSCRALMVESATDVDTFTNASPTSAQIAGGLGQFWSKGYNTAAAADWFVVADEKLFYLFVKCFPDTTTILPHLPHFFGDIIDFKPGSVLGCVLGGGYTVAMSSGPLGTTVQPGGFVVAGGKNGILKSQLLWSTNTVNHGVGSANVYPSDVDGGLVISSPVLLNEATSTGHYRGVMPGLAYPLAKTDTVLNPKTIISNIVGSAKVFICANQANAVGNNSATVVPLIDLTGPWR